jgi:CTP:molybdopterin cytidylyltransferase MocA
LYSLQTGLSEAESQWYLYHFVDQPSLPISFYSEFVKQIDVQFNWIQPTYNNRKGHPILFDNQVRELILHCSESETLRDVARDKSINKKFWECGTDLIFEDIDTQNDFINL